MTYGVLWSLEGLHQEGWKCQIKYVDLSKVANPSEGVADESKTARPQTLLLLIFCIYKFGKWQKKGNKTLAD